MTCQTSHCREASLCLSFTSVSSPGALLPDMSLEDVCIRTLLVSAWNAWKAMLLGQYPLHRAVTAVSTGPQVLDQPLGDGAARCQRTQRAVPQQQPPHQQGACHRASDVTHRQHPPSQHGFPLQQPQAVTRGLRVQLGSRALCLTCRCALFHPCPQRSCIPLIL